jgi:hypothetical protein
VARERASGAAARAIGELKVDHQLGRPAPYQQLVLLWAIAGALRGEDRLRSFSAVRDELRVLLAPLAVGQSQPDPELPWFALRRSPWWEIHPLPDRPVPRGGRDWVRSDDPIAGLERTAHRLVREDAVFCDRVVARLSAALPAHLAEQTLRRLRLLDPVPPASENEATRLLRSLVGRELGTTTGRWNRVLVVVTGSTAS